jgi:hypothetical protein
MPARSPLSILALCWPATLALLGSEPLKDGPEQTKAPGMASADPPAMVISQSSDPAPGHIFTALKSGSEGHLVAYDREGTMVFHRRFTHYVENLHPWPDGKISYFDFRARAYIILNQRQQIEDTVSMQNGYRADFHDFIRLPEGGAILMCYDVRLVDMSQIVSGGDKNASLTGLVIQEIDKNHDLVFEWRSWDHIDVRDSYADLTMQHLDLIHANSMNAGSNNTLIISCRNTSEIIKISRDNGNILWRMAGKNNEFTRSGDPKGFTGQHAVARLANGNLLMFDNSIDLATDPWLNNPGESGFSETTADQELNSRGLEYRLDEKARTIKFYREFRHDPEYQSQNMGYIQRIPNGHTLITWGSADTKAGMEITEYDSAGQVCFEAGIEGETANYYKVYKDVFISDYFQVSADTLDFGETYSGSSKSLDLVIKNDGEEEIRITSILRDDPQFSLKATLPILLTPGGNTLLEAVFQPMGSGYREELITLCSDAENSRTSRQVLLRGSGKFHLTSHSLPEREMQIYPNPGKELLTIVNLRRGEEILCLDLSGRVRWKATAREETFQLDVSELPPGYYHIQVWTLKGRIITLPYLHL